MSPICLRNTLFLFSLLFISISTLSQPRISSFSPIMGPAGSSVTIVGSNFSTVANDNVVYFGGVKASVTAASQNSLTVIVPASAQYAPISVTVNGYTSYSAYPFRFTFQGGGAITAEGFEARKLLLTEENPVDIGSVDIDGDGKPDLVVINGSYPFSISVFLNISENGSIAFAQKVEFPTGQLPENLAIGDIDGDGRPDVAVSNYGSFTVSIFRNTSVPGTLSLARSDLQAVNPENVEIGDFDKDGRPDLLVSNPAGKKISVFRNISTPGQIVFDPRIDYETVFQPGNLKIADIDGDSWPDFAVIDNDIGSLAIYWNLGNANKISFIKRAGPETGIGTTNLVVADLNGDNKPDLGVLGNDQLTVYRNRSSPGGVINFDGETRYPTSINPQSATYGDIDGDGKADLTIAGENEISVFRNNSTSGSILFDERADLSTGEAPFNILIADLNGDQRPEIVTVDQADNTVSIFKNKVNGPNIKSFSPTKAAAGSVIFIEGSNFTGITEVSFGGVPARSFNIISASKISAIVDNGASGDVAVKGPEGTAKKSGFIISKPPEITSYLPAIGGPGSVIIITGTGFENVSAVTFGGTNVSAFTIESETVIKVTLGGGASGQVTVTTILGTASLAGFTYYSLSPSPVINSFSPLSGSVGTSMTITGANFSASLSDNIVRFGAVRAIVTASSSNTLNVIVPPGAAHEPITVTCNRLTASSALAFSLSFPGGPAFTEGSLKSYEPVESTQGPRGICATDIDGDGKVDIVHGYDYHNHLGVFRNISSGNDLSFSSPVNFLTAQLNRTVITGDIDGDGKPDVIGLSEQGAQSISILRNTSVPGIISFEPRIEIAGAISARDIIMNDFDGDGRPDLAVAVSAGDYLTIYRNLSVPGMIQFSKGQDIPAGDGPVELATGDLDGDNYVELIVMNINQGSVSIYHNQSNIGLIKFSAPSDIQTGIRPASITVDDFDGNSQLDLAVTITDSTVKIYRNISTIGTIRFGPVVVLPAPGSPQSIKSVDLDGDAKPELVLISARNHTLAVYKNLSSPGILSYAKPAIYPKKEIYQEIVPADYDGDGKTDLAIGLPGPTYSFTIYKNLIAAANVVPAGVNPARDISVNYMHFQPTVQSYNGKPYVQRHYEISPQEDKTTATATITLYFTQSDFDNFNAHTSHGPDLPRHKNDSSGIVNLKVYQFHGTANISLPENYADTVETINPADAKIVWNEHAECWEITFDVEGFSGFFVSSAEFVGAVVPKLSASGALAFCEGGSVTLSSSESMNNQWFKNGIAIPGETSGSLIAKTTGLYTVNITSGNTISEFSNAIKVTVSPKPAQPVITSNGIMLSSSSAIGNQWFADGQSIAGAIQQTYSPSKSTNYTVQVTTDGCTSKISNEYYFVIAPVLTTDGNPEFCEGQSVNLISSATDNNKWYTNGIELIGAHGKTYKATQSGSYTVTTTSNGVVSASSESVLIKVKAIPAKPAIIANGHLLRSTALTGNQWYLDGKAIPGAQAVVYQAVATGNYNVSVTDNGCLSPLSDNYYFVITGIVNIDNDHFIRINPNPSRNYLILTHKVAGSTLIDCQIIGLDGQLKASYSKLSSGTRVDISKLNSGLHLFKIIDPQTRKSYVLKFIKE